MCRTSFPFLYSCPQVLSRLLASAVSLFGLILLSSVITVTSGCGKARKESPLLNIFGDDGRVELDVTKFPGSALGWIDLGCTGALIGKRLAVTAAHCIVDQSAGVMRAGLGSFKVGHKGDRDIGESRIAAAWVGTAKPDDSRKDDWAILLLTDDLGSANGWFGLKNINFATGLPLTVQTAGYGTDKGSGSTPLISKNCYIHRLDEAQRLLHDCDAVTGVSGGPMFFENGSTATIIALTVAEFRRGESSMRLESYSHELANIGISVAGPLRVIEKIKPAIDSSLAIPEVSDAIYMVNLSSSAGSGNGAGSDPGSDIRRGGGSIAANAERFVEEAGIVLYQLKQISAYAIQGGFHNLWNHAAWLQSPTERVSLGAFYLSRGEVSPEYGAAEVESAVRQMSAAMKVFVAFFEGGQWQEPQVCRDLGGAVDQMKTSMTRLEEMVSLQN